MFICSMEQKYYGNEIGIVSDSHEKNETDHTREVSLQFHIYPLLLQLNRVFSNIQRT